MFSLKQEDVLLERPESKATQLLIGIVTESSSSQDDRLHFVVDSVTWRHFGEILSGDLVCGNIMWRIFTEDLLVEDLHEDPLWQRLVKRLDEDISWRFFLEIFLETPLWGTGCIWYAPHRMRLANLFPEWAS